MLLGNEDLEGGGLGGGLGSKKDKKDKSSKKEKKDTAASASEPIEIDEKLYPDSLKHGGTKYRRVRDGGRSRGRDRSGVP